MSNLKKYHVCHVGTFDLKSFGDTMFPRLFKLEMERRFGDDIQVDFYSITSCINEYNKLGQIYSFSQIEENHNKYPYDLMVIGGGEFIHYEEISFYNVLNEKVSRTPGDLWRTPQIEAEKLGIPVVWNCVGAGRDFVDAWQQNDIKSFSDRLLYASVRDRFSYERLKNQWKLYDVEPKTAAMIMAIVADKMGKPLNELRFISIKEVK